MSPVLPFARRYLKVGLSVIPVRADGSKAPALAGWRRYAYERPADAQLLAWFADGRFGIGVVCGPASGGLYVYDFETEAAYLAWREKVEANRPAFFAGLPIVKTPSGGRHVWLRDGSGRRGGVLARDPAGKVLVEVRGEGHQVVAPGSPRECHPTRRHYGFEQSGWVDG